MTATEYFQAFTVAIGTLTFAGSAWKYLRDSKAHQAERMEQTKQLQEQTIVLTEIRDDARRTNSLG